MSETTLFPEPARSEPVTTDGHWAVARLPEHWRYMELGEDSEALVIQGHDISDEAITPLVLEVEPSADSDYDWSDFATRTWMRQLSRCEEHGQPDEGCRCCIWFGQYEGDPPEGSDWWTWSTKPGEAHDANRNRPGYFPVTVVNLEP